MLCKSDINLVCFQWGCPNETSLRNGFWVMSSKKASEDFGEIVVKRWDKYNELLEEYVHSILNTAFVS